MQNDAFIGQSCFEIFLGDRTAAVIFVNGIQKQHTQVLREFIQAQDDVYNHLKAKVNPDSYGPRHGPISNLSTNVTTTQTTKQPQGLEPRYPIGSSAPYQSRMEPSRQGNVEHTASTAPRHAPSATDIKLSEGVASLSFKGPKEEQGRHSDPPHPTTHLGADSRYEVHKRGFFSPGRVFEVHWHSTSDALSFSRVTVEQLHNQPVHLFIRRLVVIRDHIDACTCIAIRTYGERGLVRSRLSQEDIDAHAIIHMAHEPSRTLPGEPAMRKKPIAVTPAAYDQKLSAASRIDFSKPQDIPYDKPVMNIGHVTAASLPYLERYYKEEQRR